MYTVYCDGKCIYNVDVDGLIIAEPKLEMELNKVGSFSFTIYPDHPYYNNVHQIKSIITVYYDSDVVFSGRVLAVDRGFCNEKYVLCEGELAYLLDSIQRPYDFMTGDNHTTISELLEYFITNHNEQVADDKRKFKIGNITVTDDNDYIVRKNSDYSTTWKEINDKLIDKLGGYIFTRHESDGIYIDYLSDSERINKQNVEFGKNLISISISKNLDGMVTALIPLGAKISNDEDAKRLTIKDVNDGIDYIFDEDAVNEFGHIFKTEIFDGVTLPENLLEKGRKSLSENILIPSEIEVAAADLAGTGVDIAPFMFGAYINVASEPHGLLDKMLASKMTIIINNPAANKMVLGKKSKTLTEFNSDSASSNKNIVERVEKVESNAKINEGAIEDLREDTNSTIIALRDEVGSQITQSAESVKTSVYDNVYVKDEVDSLVSSVSTEVEQTKTGWEYIFNQFQLDVNDIANGNDAKFEEIRKYIRFEDGNIILGNTESPLVLKIQNDRISFIQNGYEVAYISDRKMYNTICHIRERLEIGDSAWQVEYNEDGDTVVSLMPIY